MAFGDDILGEPEVMVAEDALAFEGMAPPALFGYRIEIQVAEMLEGLPAGRVPVQPHGRSSFILPP